MPSARSRPACSRSRNYPGFLGALFPRPAPHRHRLALPHRGARQGRVDPPRQEAVLGRGLPAQRDRPAGPYFRGMLPDAERPGRLLDPDRLKASWSETVDADRNALRVHRRAAGQGEGAPGAEHDLGRHWFNNLDNRRGTREVLPRAGRRSRRPSGTRTPCRSSASGPGNAAQPRGRPQEADRPARGPRSRSCRAPSIALATPEQQAAVGRRTTPPWTFLDVANMLTMYGLCAMGVCLILGFLTPFAASARRPSWR